MNEQPTKLEAVAGIFGALGQIIFSLGCLLILLPMLAVCCVALYILVRSVI